MKLYKNLMIAAGFVAAFAQAPITVAKAPADELSRLGNDLTPMGAEKAGNAEGSIPEWTGGLTSPPAGFVGDKGHPDPFAGDEILLTIDAGNYQEHKDKLSDGHIAMLKKYPDTFKMNVYPTRRSAAYPQKVYDACKSEGAVVEKTNNGNGLSANSYCPFPLPKDALDVIWNHITRYRGDSVHRYVTQSVVQENGAFKPTKLEDYFIWPHVFDNPEENRLYYFFQKVNAPARLEGNVLLVHEPLDQIKETRLAWLYNAGQRRVRRAPQVAYDGPGTASEGARTADNYDMFNGAADRYNWKLVGKKELYIPYNSYKLDDTSLKYEDILQKGHINPDLLRYELHRVWVVEAELKEGKRHIYAKRRFYVDEDSWGIAVVDHYDGRGELWRLGEGHAIQYYEALVPWYRAETLYDLQSGRYLALGLANEEKRQFEWGVKTKFRNFTPAALRRAGRK
ncbi:MAG: DUF1329 domain-containing protein [Candidatus Thiodiazotropha endolucinida]